MNKEKTNQLYKRYPELFIRHTMSIQESSMSFGFQCGGGWLDIIDATCSHIMEVCERNRIPAPQVECVKEKFAGLRFYIDAPFIDNETDDNIYTIINQYEGHSFLVCEVCGADGELATTGHWVKTICDDCMKMADYQHYRRVED